MKLGISLRIMLAIIRVMALFKKKTYHPYGQAYGWGTVLQIQF